MSFSTAHFANSLTSIIYENKTGLIFATVTGRDHADEADTQTAALNEEGVVMDNPGLGTYHPPASLP